jgi:hypothetical protein
VIPARPHACRCSRRAVESPSVDAQNRPFRLYIFLVDFATVRELGITMLSIIFCCLVADLLLMQQHL